MEYARRAVLIASHAAKAGDRWPTYDDDHARARALVERMTLAEKLSLVSARMGSTPDPPPGAIGSAACTPGIERLGVPTWDESDASLGVTNPGGARGDDPDVTAFPSATALAATFDRALAERAGRAIGVEARERGISVQLAGGMNLVREPRGGRVFEYLSEDVLLSGLMAGAAVRGIQAEGVVSTVKHFALNPQETGRVMVSSDLSEQALRESDLLAFEIALEHGGPRSVMSGYNLVNKVYAGESHHLLSQVLKGDWGFRGFVMSDWGATHSTEHAVLAGQDRQSGWDLDTAHFFGDRLRAAVEEGRVPEARVDDMVVRILAALASVGALDERRVALPPERRTTHREVAAAVAEQSIVLLKNDDALLPLSPSGRLVVVGRSAAVGTLSGGGSSTVTPGGSVQSEGIRIAQMALPRVHHAPAPLDALARRFADVLHVPDAAALPSTLRPDDTAVVLVEKWATEGLDATDLGLGDDQDALVDAVAALTDRVVVVLQTAGAVLMPWHDRVPAVLATWYAGTAGAEALAAVLSGDVNPSGRLPISFPADEALLPRPEMLDPATTTSNPGEPRRGAYVSVDYDVEGADVGYRWWERRVGGATYGFGHGLSYTSFVYRDLVLAHDVDDHVVVRVTVENVGEVAGTDTPQVYVAPLGGTHRLAGWARVHLRPGESREVSVVLDEERVFATYDPHDPGWTVAAGELSVRVSRGALVAPDLEETVLHPGRRMRP